MKTDRMTLLISPADKAAINARAGALGISVSELMRKAALEYEPDDSLARAEVEALLPEFSATITHIHEAFQRMIERLDASERRHVEMESPEYKAAVREALQADPTIDWDRIRALVNSDREAA